jgi:hypothetical protein
MYDGQRVIPGKSASLDEGHHGAQLVADAHEIAKLFGVERQARSWLH